MTTLLLLTLELWVNIIIFCCHLMLLHILVGKFAKTYQYVQPFKTIGQIYFRRIFKVSQYLDLFLNFTHTRINKSEYLCSINPTMFPCLI